MVGESGGACRLFLLIAYCRSAPDHGPRHFDWGAWGNFGSGTTRSPYLRIQFSNFEIFWGLAPRFWTIVEHLVHLGYTLWYTFQCYKSVALSTTYVIWNRRYTFLRDVNQKLFFPEKSVLCVPESVSPLYSYNRIRYTPVKKVYHRCSKCTTVIYTWHGVCKDSYVWRGRKSR
jgi:hypothetical protein